MNLVNLELRQCADEYISAIECAVRLHDAGQHAAVGEALAALDNSHRQFVAFVGRRADDRMNAKPKVICRHARRVFAS